MCRGVRACGECESASEGERREGVSYVRTRRTARPTARRAARGRAGGTGGQAAGEGRARRPESERKKGESRNEVLVRGRTGAAPLPPPDSDEAPPAALGIDLLEPLLLLSL